MVPRSPEHQKRSIWMGSKLSDSWKSSNNDKLKVGRHKWSKKWKVWQKNDVSQIDRESIWDGPWTFRTSKNIILDGFTLKKTQKMTNSKSPKFHEKLKYLTTFWTLFSQISHAGACVAWRRASRQPWMTRRAYFLMLDKSNTGSGWG